MLITSNLFLQTEESKITRYELASNLARCLTCVEEFAEFCIPLALNKLEASLKVAKIDSLQLLVNHYFLIKLFNTFQSYKLI